MKRALPPLDDEPADNGNRPRPVTRLPLQFDVQASMTFRRIIAVLAAFFVLATTLHAPAAAQGADLATQVRDKAALAVSQFQKRAAGRLDYSERSLLIVEDMLTEASRYAKEMSPADVSALVELMGSYVLEVGRRQHGGALKWDNARSQPVLVVGEPQFSVAIMTFDKIRKRLSGDQADSIVFFYQGFSSQVKTATPGTIALYV